MRCRQHAFPTITQVLQDSSNLSLKAEAIYSTGRFIPIRSMELD